MTAKEALNNIAIISEILVEVSKSHIMSNKAINEIRKLDIGEIYFTLNQALTELEVIKSVDGGEILEELNNIYNKPFNILQLDNAPLSAVPQFANFAKHVYNYILKAQAQEQELRELKANQIKIKDILALNYSYQEIGIKIERLFKEELK